LSTARFDTLWQEAYDREFPVLSEAARLSRTDPELARNPVVLFRMARDLVRAADCFAAYPGFFAQGPDPGHVAMMAQLLD
jgi:hypothetical protein